MDRRLVPVNYKNVQGDRQLENNKYGMSKKKTGWNLMKKIRSLLELMQKNIENGYKSEHAFSTLIEDYIHDNFWQINEENEDVATYLNDDVLDICEQTELGLEGTQFRTEVVEAYHKLLKMAEMIGEAGAR